MADVQEILSDPNFQALPLPEKNKVLLRVDPNFRGLAPQERMKVLSVIQYHHPLPELPKRLSLQEGIKQAAYGAALPLAGLGQAVLDVPQFVKQIATAAFAPPQSPEEDAVSSIPGGLLASRLVVQPMQEEAQKAKETKGPERIAHAVASGIPVVGPMVAGIGESIQKPEDVPFALGRAVGWSELPEISKASPMLKEAAAQIPKIAEKGKLDVMIGTNPERIAEIAQVPGKMAGVQSLVTAAEKSTRSKAAAKFPTIENLIEISRQVVEQPTGLVDEQGNSITRHVEQVERITFPELQKRYSELGMQIATEKEAVRNGAPAFQLRELIEQRKKINQLMTDAARKEDKLPQLNEARKAWSKFEDDFHNPSSPLRRLLTLSPDQTAEIASHLNRGTNAARAVEVLKSNGIDPSLIRSVMATGRKPLAVNVTESGKLRTAGSVSAYRQQRLRESLRQATTNEMPSGSEARLPAWAMRRLLPGILSEVPVGPRELTALRLRRELRK